MLNSKLIGGILLIIGTSIGGGMLALPLSTAAAGFFHSLLFLTICWFIMTMGALLILEVNLHLPAGSNLISMAKKTLGFPGQILAWITTLLLLYTLLAAYISGGGDIINIALRQLMITPPLWLGALLFTILLGYFVYLGIKAIDYINRGLMIVKLSIYFLLIALISPHTHLATLKGGSLFSIHSSLMVLITSFGFASIVPSLREYFDQDIVLLRKAIIVGSLIPLLCYILWNATIMGVIPRTGSQGLIALEQEGNAATGLLSTLTNLIHNQWIISFFAFFSAICMVTAFLAVSIGLFDFLADGLKLKRKGSHGGIVLFLTFAPPFFLVIYKPNVYLQALSYAGVCCVILLIVLPTIMTWRSRRLHPNTHHLVPGGDVMLFCLLTISIIFLIFST